MIIAQDIGSGLTKYRSGKIKGHFPSLIGSVDEIDNVSGALGLPPQHAFRYEGRLYLTGEVAASKVAHKDLFNTNNDEFALSKENMVLMVSGILATMLSDTNKTMGKTEENRIKALSETEDPQRIDLVLGLPIAKFGDHKSEYEQSVLGLHTVQLLTGEFIKFYIDSVKVLPQAAATIYTLQNALPKTDWSQRHVGLVDVGTHTVGLANFFNGNFVPDESEGFSNAGMNSLARLASKPLQSFTHTPLRIDRLLNGFRRGSLMLNGNDIDLLKFVENLDPLNPSLKRFLSEVWNAGSDREVFIVGGGSTYFSPAIKKIIPHAQLLESDLNENIYAVVDGMYQHYESHYE